MNVFSGSLSHRVLLAALIGLTGLYLLWFGATPHPWVSLLVFALPPALLVAASLRGMRAAAFWAGMLGLLWFSHGVMVAWSRPAERLFACIEIVLALVAIFAASWPGLRARFGRRG